jgi:hypothetical protein
MSKFGTWRQQIGEFFSIGGELLFWLTWWLPIGFSLGGSPTLLDTFYSELAVTLPISGVGLILWWTGKLILSPKLNPQKILFPLLWLLAWGISALFSFDPATSISCLLVWAVGLLAIGTKETFFATGARRIFFGISLIAGFSVIHWFPDINVSSTLLSIGAVWGLIYLAWEPSFVGKFFWQIFFLIGVFFSNNLAIEFAALMVLRFGRRWFGVSSGKKSPFWLAIIIWGVTFGWKLAENGPYILKIQPYWIEASNNWLQLLFGIGEGQFLVGLQHFSPTLLNTIQLQIPESGAILTFFEHGVIGIILMLILLLFTNLKRPSFLSRWLVFYWIYSSVFLAR